MNNLMKKIGLVMFWVLTGALAMAQGKVVRYDLNIRDTTVSYGHKTRHAMAVNGQIPMPTLYFTEGDTAEIHVHNYLKEETSLHWHGLILPNQYDGVSYLTTRPIRPGTTHIFRFPLVQHGTYWYHSHTMFQEQSGLYGAFIIREKKTSSLPEIPVLLSDWTDMNPAEVNRSLHNATDWFSIRKGAVQSYAEALRSGHFKTKLSNEWKRMTAMDVSDVAYDRFLINGRTSQQEVFRAGQQVRLRIINGSSSSYFWLHFAGGQMQVVASDGEDVVPVTVDRLLIAVSETYDVLLTIPAGGSYELLATPEDRTGSASLWLGEGTPRPAAPLPRLRYFEGMKMMNGMMRNDGNLKEMPGMKMQNQVMDMNTVMYPELGEGKKTVTLNYDMLRAPAPTRLPEAPLRQFNFELTGNMNRYVWSINNKTVSESDKILIRKGENIRIVLYNNTMMRHPMHLHGHYFRVLNGQGDYAPLKNVLDIMPMERDTIEFAANASGDWFFHCHILYHMMSGMGRVFSYENSAPNPEVPDPAMGYKMVQMDDKKLHPMARVALESKGTDGEIVLSNTRYRLSTEWRAGFGKTSGYESESHLGRYIGKMQWLFPYAGWDFRKRTVAPGDKNLFGQSLEPGNTLFGQRNTRNFRQVFHIGLQYTLPMLVVADASLDHRGNLRFQLMREDIPLSKRLRMNFMVNTDKEYIAGLRYTVNKYFGFSTHYDSDWGYGGGITLNY